MVYFLNIPTLPSLVGMLGTALDSKMLSEMLRLLSSLIGQLGAFYNVYKSL